MPKNTAQTAQKHQTFAEQLSEWMEKEVFRPLNSCWMGEYEDPVKEIPDQLWEKLARAEAEVKEVIRQKVLESYGAGARKAEAKARAGQREGKGRSLRNEDQES